MNTKKHLYDEIAKVAYELYEKRGCSHGYALEDWVEAERVVMQRYANEIEEEAEIVKTARKLRSSAGTETKAEKPRAAKPKGLKLSEKTPERPEEKTAHTKRKRTPAKKKTE